MNFAPACDDHQRHRPGDNRLGAGRTGDACAMLCCVTPIPTRRNGLPNKKDVKDGVIGACARPPFTASAKVAATPVAIPPAWPKQQTLPSAIRNDLGRKCSGIRKLRRGEGPARRAATTP